MAAPDRLNSDDLARIPVTDGVPVLVRAAPPEWGQLLSSVSRRYPLFECATFARFGWRESPHGLVLTLAAIDSPRSGELDESVGHVRINEPYTLRVALAAERHPLAVGIIHSHPSGALPTPSDVDDDMDGYFAQYFGDFAPGRPYVSLILARRTDGSLAGSGRVFWRGRWYAVRRFAIFNETGLTQVGVGAYDEVDRNIRRRNEGTLRFARVARLATAFGERAAERLMRATVAVIGTSGTGSPAIEALARAGVGHIIVVDPQQLAESNLERVHGSEASDVDDGPLTADGERLGPAKAAIARRHIERIDPSIRITALVGRLPQAEVLDAVTTADVVIGATDLQSSRVALSDLAVRYCVPVIDTGVVLEGESGNVSGQIVQLTRFLPSDACVYCRGMIDPRRVMQELLSDSDRRARRGAAVAALERGDAAGAYWQTEAQLPTIGYLTTVAGTLAAGYAIGWITGRFAPPFVRLQMNLNAPCFDVTDLTTAHEPPRPDCDCRRMRGHADQGSQRAFIHPPEHWAKVVEVGPAPRTQLRLS